MKGLLSQKIIGGLVRTSGFDKSPNQYGSVAQLYIKMYEPKTEEYKVYMEPVVLNQVELDKYLFSKEGTEKEFKRELLLNGLERLFMKINGVPQKTEESIFQFTFNEYLNEI